MLTSLHLKILVLVILRNCIVINVDAFILKINYTLKTIWQYTYIAYVRFQF